MGGSARNLAKVAGGAALDRMLSVDRLARVMAELEDETSVRFATRRRINAWRARLLPAGVAILEAVLDRAGRPVLQVSRAGLREGLALASVRAGSSWREALPELAKGWRD